MKKSILVLCILLAMSVIFVGCSEQQVPNSVDNSGQEASETNTSSENEKQQVANGPEADEIVLSVVKKLETYDHSFSNYGILYDVYVNKISKLFYEEEVPVFKEDSHFELIYVPAGQEAKEYDEAQRKEAIATVEKEVTIEFSEVFTDEDRNWKYVYTKSTIVDLTKEEGPQTSYIYRRYVLTESDNEWKILSLDQFNCEEGTPEKEIKFNKYNNEIVEYPEVIPFL